MKRSAKKPVAKKRVSRKKVSKDGVLCRCGCGEEVKKLFLQGHDARFHGRVKKLSSGKLVISDLGSLDPPVQPYALPYYKEGTA